MADYVINKIPEGTYVILGGDKRDLNAGFVKNGQLKALEKPIKEGKIKVDYNVFVEDWALENASHEIKKYLDLSGEKPAVVLAACDKMALGIVETLKEFGMEGKVLVTGQDAELPACQNIVKGYQVMTVYKPLKKLAYTAAELSMKIIRSQTITEATSKVNNGTRDVPSILLDPIAVDKDNLKSTVIADGYLSESDVYKQ
jgi:D-xylose transport system substrate-binding protein